MENVTAFCGVDGVYFAFCPIGEKVGMNYLKIEGPSEPMTTKCWDKSCLCTYKNEIVGPATAKQEKAAWVEIELLDRWGA